MDKVDDAGAAILDEIAVLEVERGHIESSIAARMLDLADLRRRESEKTTDSRIRKLEASFAADELSLVLFQPAMTVQRRLAQARRVRGRLPLVWLAWRDGRIDHDRVRAIDEAAVRLEHRLSLLALDDKVPAYAASHTLPQLKGWLRRFVARVEPGNATERHRYEYSRRCVYVDHDVDGVAWIHGLISSADAARIDTLLTSFAKGMPATDARTTDQRRADHFVDLLLGRTDQSGIKTDRNHGGATIGVTVPIESLSGLDQAPGESFDRRFLLPPHMVRDLAAEPGTLFYRLLTDPRGRLLDVTEIGRFPSARLKTALEIRDGVCAFPTCNVAAQGCDKDHARPAPEGATKGANLKNLCRRHHRMKTANIVATQMDADDHQWHLPDGSDIASEQHVLPTRRRQPHPSKLTYDLATFAIKHAK